MQWGEGFENQHELQPGDSVYVCPMVPHRFCHVDGAAAGEARVGGALELEAQRLQPYTTDAACRVRTLHEGK